MESKENEQQNLVEISINYQGIDVTAVVTLEEANVLLNDEAAASRYAQAVLAQDHQEEQEILQARQSKTDYTFSTREATLLFLKLRTKYNDKFNDRKTLKQALCQKIAGEMKNKGFDIQDGREGAEKCRQKFASLQRSYLNYIKHIETTGIEKKDPPPYFDEIHAILGNKDKVNPPYLEDSLDTSHYDEDEPTASCSNTSSNASSILSNEHRPSSLGGTDMQKLIKNRFSSHTTSIRRTTNFNKVIDLLKEQHEQLRQDKAQHMKLFEDAVKVQNEQSGQFLKLLKKTEKRKRSRNSSSSSSNE